jgi:hypothetical protein
MDAERLIKVEIEVKLRGTDAEGVIGNNPDWVYVQGG